MAKNHARTALIILTALNFVNYIDRSVLFAVQSLIKTEMRLTDFQVGMLTSAFLGCYMVAAPLIGPLADRYKRKYIMVAGAVVWSAATLLTAFTYTYGELLFRHAIVGIGEATFVAIAPAFLSDLYPQKARGRMLSIFYLAIPMGTAMGYLLGGHLGPLYGWRAPFYVGAVPGVILAAILLMVPEPERGAQDIGFVKGAKPNWRELAKNPAYLTATFGMAMMTFAVGGMQVWIPTFLHRMRNVSLADANLYFGAMTIFSGLFATLAGGWLGDRLLRRNKGAYYWVSAVGMLISLPAIIGAVTLTGKMMYAAIFIGEFFLLLNTAPLNAALVNSVGAGVRATAVAVNLFIIHALGDASSPSIIGWVSDHANLQLGLLVASVAVVISVVILFYGMRFAPNIAVADLPHAGRAS